MLQRFLKYKTPFRITEYPITIISFFPYFVIIFFPNFLSSCSSSPKTHFDKSFQEEYPDGTLKMDCKFVGQLNETHCLHHCKLYHPNGNLAEEGDFINDSIATGWHTYYRANSTLKARREFFELSPNLIYLNQVIRFEINGDTAKDASNYYSIHFDKDTINPGDYLNAHFKLEAPYFKKSYIQVTIAANESNEILATKRTLESDNTIKSPVSKGEYELKGFIEEIESKERSGDTIKVQKRPLYFNRTYWVR